MGAIATAVGTLTPTASGRGRFTLTGSVHSPLCESFVLGRLGGRVLQEVWVTLGGRVLPAVQVSSAEEVEAESLCLGGGSGAAALKKMAKVRQHQTADAQ